MKKILFSLSALFAFGLANAQNDEPATGGFSAGDAFISGTLNYNSQKTGDLKNNEFNITPSVGYFVSDNFAVGAVVSYRSSENNFDPYDYYLINQSINEFSVGAFGRYYFNPSAKFNVFTQLMVAYTTAKVEQVGFDDFDPIFSPQTEEVTVNGFGVAFAPGFNYWLSDHFALEANFGILSYSTAKPDYDNAESTDAFSIGLDLSDINFGLIYKF